MPTETTPALSMDQYAARFADENVRLRSEIERLSKELSEAKEIIAEFVKAHGTGALELNSPEIGGHDDIPLHPWHEEWLHHARAALSKATGGSHEQG